MTSTYGTKYGASLIIGSTIQEEDEEEDFNDVSAGGSQSERSPALISAAKGVARAPTNRGDRGNNINGSRSSVGSRADKDRRLSRLAVNAVTSIASAASKLVSGFLHSQPEGGQHGHSGQPGKALTDGTPLAAASAKHLGDCRHNQSATDRSSGLVDTLSRRKLSCLDGHLLQPPSQHRGHLVRLVASDDVRLALHALKLAAQIHDHLWGPEGTAADAAGSREALLEAASPLYDMAMSAARAIQHRALHSLVKQAVRRYVNPCRGSPDDVLRVILELLTGCGGKAAAAAAPPPLQPLSTFICRGASRCMSDVASGERSGGSASPAAGSPRFAAHRMSDPEPRSECSGDSSGGPRCLHHRASYGSSLSYSRFSARSSLDSGDSEASSSRLPRLAGLRA